MRRYVALLLVLIFTLSLVGCNAGTTADTATDTIDVANNTTTPKDNAETESSQKTPTSPTSSDATISNDEAIKIALDKAQLTKEDILGLHCELDYDNGMLKYEVEFSDKKYDYDCEINAESGKILHFEKELDD